VDAFDEAKPVEKQPDFPQPTKSDSPTLPETNRDKSHKPRPPKVEFFFNNFGIFLLFRLDRNESFNNFIAIIFNLRWTRFV
jgi:hypothetical protein